jgi:rod shape determining protein RodA
MEGIGDKQSLDTRSYDYLPISESDFIFAVAGEEFGFLGCCLILSLYAVIIYICVYYCQTGI